MSGWGIDVADRSLERTGAVRIVRTYRVTPRQQASLDRLRAYLEQGYSVRLTARQDGMPCLRTLRYWVSPRRDLGGLRELYGNLILLRTLTRQSNKPVLDLGRLHR